MKQIKFNRFFQIIYPLLVYYVFYNVTYSLSRDFLGSKIGSLACLLLAGMVTIIPELIILKKAYTIHPAKAFSLKEDYKDLLYIILVVALGIALNVLITQTGLTESSKGFSDANRVLSDGSIVIKILCNVIMIPILEEVLYRGIICGQLYNWYGTLLATIISAFCFGFLHFNIVQFLYAFIVGLALSAVYCKCKRLWVVIIAHGLTNLIVILFA